MVLDNFSNFHPDLAREIEQLKNFPAQPEQQLAWAEKRNKLAQECFVLGQTLEARNSSDLAVQAYWHAHCLNLVAIDKRVKLEKLLTANVSSISKINSQQLTNLASIFSAKDYFYAGLCVEWGISCQVDEQEAANYYKLAADLGNADALSRLGLLYYLGNGVPQNYAEAARLYRLAAEQGCASAQNGLGYMISKGKDVLQNYAEAFAWFDKAAKQGHAIAQFNLGSLYHTAKGIAQDYVEAAHWYRLSARNGIQNAVQALNNLYYDNEKLSLYQDSVDRFPLNSKQALACRRDIALGITAARIQLERYTAAHGFKARYHAAHGLDATVVQFEVFSEMNLFFNSALVSLMTKEPNKFCKALLADTELTDLQRLKYLRFFAKQELMSLWPENRDAVCYALVNLEGHSNIEQELADYVRPLEENSEYYAQVDGANAAMNTFSQKPNAFVALKSEIMSLEYFNLDNAQRLQSVVKLKKLAEMLSQNTQLTALDKYSALFAYVKNVREAVQVDHEKNRNSFLRFFHVNTQSSLVKLLDTILVRETQNYDMPLEEFNNTPTLKSKN